MLVILLTFVSVLSWNQGVVDCVRILDFRVATHMAEGSDALLGCTFDLAGERLYMLKWYKDDLEFYRYEPEVEQQKKSFFVNGVMVDMNRSSVNVVALRRLSRESAGKYRCEVIAEFPTFTMVFQEEKVLIDLLPKWGPKIVGLEESYGIGSQVTVNCTTAPSRPEAQLSWLINGQAVPRNHTREPYLVIPTDKPYTYQAKLLLNFTVTHSHFDHQGTMTLKCQATIAPLYHKEVEYSYHLPVFHTTTQIDEVNKDNVAPTDIPVKMLILPIILLLLVR